MSHSTSHAIIAMSDFMYQEINKLKVCIIVSINGDKYTFDKVDRTVLLRKFSWYTVLTVILFNHY
jgi:hypothetical protein